MKKARNITIKHSSCSNSQTFIPSITLTWKNMVSRKNGKVFKEVLQKFDHITVYQVDKFFKFYIHWNCYFRRFQRDRPSYMENVKNKNKLKKYFIQHGPLVCRHRRSVATKNNVRGSWAKKTINKILELNEWMNCLFTSLAKLL